MIYVIKFGMIFLNKCVIIVRYTLIDLFSYIKKIIV